MSVKTKKAPKTEFARRLAKAGYEDFLVLDKETAEKVLTPKRLELLETIEEQEPESISELAEMVDREVSAVHRDVKLLWSKSVLDYEEGARGRKKPVARRSHIFIEPVM